MVYNLVGVDVGGGTIKVCGLDYQGAWAANADGTPRIFEVPTVSDQGHEGAIRCLIDAVRGAQDAFGSQTISSIGIGLPGLLNRASGVLLGAPNLPAWAGLKVQERLTAEFRCRVRVLNDADAAAFGEASRRDEAEQGDFALLTLGTGVGGSVFVNGAPVIGYNGRGGEFGHMNIGGPDGWVCPGCGRSGCLEAYASVRGLLRHAELHQREDPTGDGVEAFFQTYAPLAPDQRVRHLVEACRSGDRVSMAIFERLARYLAVGVGSIVNIFSPRFVFIGGGVAHAGESLVQSVTSLLADRTLPLSREYTQLRLATLGNAAGAIGAALYADRAMH